MTIATVLGTLVLMFWAGVGSKPTDEYAVIADLDYCGQSCPSSCEEAEARSAICRCDSECERYGDCCSPLTGRLNCTGGEQGTQPLVWLQCRSIHLDSRTQPDLMEAFWMVSACPENWPADQDSVVLSVIDKLCRRGSNTLPPVTDLDDGVVYKNEYCAVCHQVTNIQPWGYRFGCSPCLENMVNVSVTHELIEQECIACGFHVPQAGPPPRHCFHDSLVVDECLTREVLEERTGLKWEEDVYRDIMLQCQTGPVRPVSISPCEIRTPYKNQFCAICNAEKTADLMCAKPYETRNDTDMCLRKAEQRLCSESSVINTYDESVNDTVEKLLGGGISPDGPRMRKAVLDDPQTSGSGVATEKDGLPGLGSYQYSGSGEITSGFNPDESPLPIEPEIITITISVVPEYSIPDIIVCSTPPTHYASFTLFFDVAGDSGMITSSIVSFNITIICSHGQVFDPINQACRWTICPEGFATLRGSCARVQDIPLTGTHNSSNGSVVMCEGLIVLQESEFELLDNDTLLFHNDTFEIMGYNDSSPIICSNFTQNGTVPQHLTMFDYSYPPILSILTYVCCSLSVVGCVVVLLTYSLFRELRTLPGQILMNLASTILATCLFLLVGIPVAVLAEKDELCEATAMLLHLVMLSQFSWMSIMSFELLRTFYRASRLQPVEDKSTQKKILFLYLLIGWGIPILILMVSLLVNFTTDMIQYGRDGFCWIGHVTSFYVVLLAPVALSIVFNGITFVLTFRLLYKASKDQAKLKKEQNTSYLRIYLSVLSITGLTWIFGFLAILIGDDWAWYAFIILTSTQGLVICMAFIFTQKIVGLYKKLLTPSFYSMTTSKNSSKQRTQESSLKIQCSRKSANVSIKSSKSASNQENAKPCAMSVQSTREKSGDHMSIKMDI